MMSSVTLVYLVQHGKKEPVPGDPGLTGMGREQAGGIEALPCRCGTTTVSRRRGQNHDNVTLSWLRPEVG
jgi:hypothetical protein